jgi:hypothetical protein
MTVQCSLEEVKQYLDVASNDYKDIKFYMVDLDKYKQEMTDGQIHAFIIIPLSFERVK